MTPDMQEIIRAVIRFIYGKHDVRAEESFQTAAWMWVVYLALQFFIDLTIYKGRPGAPVLAYYLVNFIPAIIFLAVSLTNLIKKKQASS